MKNRILPFLILLVIVITLYPLLFTHLVINDDILHQLNTYRIGYINNVMRAILVNNQGRLYFFSAIWALLPHLIQSNIYLKFIQIAALSSNLFLLALFIRCLIKSNFAAWMTILLGFGLMQNSWEHNPVTALPGFPTIPISILLLSYIVFIKYFEKKHFKYLLLSLIFYIISLLSYEIFILFLPIYGLIGLYKTSSMRKSIKLILPYIYATFLYLGCYIVFKLITKNSYPGVTVNNHLDLIRIFKTFWQLSITSLPTFYFFNKKYHYLLNIYSESIYPFGSLRYLVDSIQVSWIIKSVLVFACSYILFVKKSYKVVRMSILLPFIFATYIFIPNFLISLTTHYQSAVIEDTQLGMPSTYFSYLAVVLFYVVVLQFFKNYFNPLRFKHRVVFIIILLILSVSSFIVDYTNYHITLYQTKLKYKWVLVDDFIQSKEFAKVPTNTTIYAPSLWDSFGSLGIHESYWSDYFTYKSKRKITIVKKLPLTSILPIYYLKYNQMMKDRDQFVAFSRLTSLKVDSEDQIITENICVFNLSKYDEYYLFARLKSSTTNNYSIMKRVSNDYIYDHDLKKVCINKQPIYPDTLFIISNSNYKFQLGGL